MPNLVLPRLRLAKLCGYVNAALEDNPALNVAEIETWRALDARLRLALMNASDSAGAVIAIDLHNDEAACVALVLEGYLCLDEPTDCEIASAWHIAMDVAYPVGA